MDDLDLLLAALPPEVVAAVHALPAKESLIEVVLDLGRRPEARFPDSEETLLEREIDDADIAYVVDHIGSFGDDNRAGIERTLHRISAIRNRSGKIVGLTCRIGRAVYGTIEIIDDFVETGKSILIMGRPGIGKTTMLREAARVLADDMGKRVVVVDTATRSPATATSPTRPSARPAGCRSARPSLQHEVMIEAVENHMPQVIVIDEIGTELEAQAARTIAERGVQLIGTAHGNNLDNLMLNPTLSDLIGGIQSVTLGDEEARRRRTQKSVLERKAPPTFDVIIEIQDRERVMVHSDVADTVDAMLRGDPVAPELRWRDEEGVHRWRAGRVPRPASSSEPNGSPASSGAGRPGGWNPAGAATVRTAAAAIATRGRVARATPERAWRIELSLGLSTGSQRWLASDAGRIRAGDRPARPDNRPRGRRSGPGDAAGARFAVPPSGSTSRTRSGPRIADAPFVAGDIADRGPLERGDTPLPEPRARVARELQRQQAWREQATRAIVDLKADEGTGPVNGADLEAAVADEGDTSSADETGAELSADDGSILRVEGAGALPTLRVLPHGVSRKRLEQAVRELQLPVVVARDVDEADVVMTLRSEYRQKTPMLREAEDRAMPIYVLKSNTILQMEASLTSIFSLEVDPREAALRETEEAIDLVMRQSEAVELSPQNAYVRRLQHQMAERANLVSRSRGREPYRRVRLYPRQARAGWR